MKDGRGLDSLILKLLSKLNVYVDKRHQYTHNITQEDINILRDLLINQGYDIDISSTYCMNNSVNFPSGIFDKISIPNIKYSEENATKKPLNKEQESN